MRIGIRDNCLRRPTVEAIAAAASVGLDAVEICIGQDTAANVLWQDGGYDAVNQACEAAGIVISSLSPGYFASVHPVVDDPAMRQQGHDLLLDVISRCAPVGATYILVPMFPKDMNEWPDSKWTTLIEGFKPLAEAAANAGLQLALETTFSADHLDRILDGVDNEQFVVYYDTANTTNLGYHSPTEIRQLGRRVGKVHVKDTDGNQLGDGRVPWADCRQALLDIGYDDWYVLETPAGDEPVARAARNYGFARGWMAP